MNNLVDAIITLAKGFASVSNIYIGSLPNSESISIYNAPSGEGTVYFDKKSTYSTSFTFLSKYENQKTAMSKLDLIGKGMQQLTTFPSLTDFQIYNIGYTTRVHLVEKTNDNNWIYSIVISVDISDK